MSKRLLLHIGTGKTGSTALQESLYFAHKNEQLGAITYPRLLGRHHHNELCTLVQPHDRVRRDIKSKFPTDDSNYRDFTQRLLKAFQHQLVDADQVIISGEYFCGFSAEEAQRLIQLFHHAGFAEIHVVVYFREPVSLYLSQVQQRLKASSRFNVPAGFYYDYREVIDIWSGLATSFTARDFDRKVLVGGDIVDDFLLIASEQFGQQLLIPEIYRRNENTSVSAAGMKILQEFRKLYYSDSDNVFNDESNRLLALIKAAEKDLLEVRKPKLRSEIKALILARHLNQITALRKLTTIRWEISADVTPQSNANNSVDDQDITQVIEFTEHDQREYHAIMQDIAHRLIRNA